MNLLRWAYVKIFKPNLEPDIFSVVITKKYIDKTGKYSSPIDQYSEHTDCPLYRAIKEQYPLFPLYNVYLDSLVTYNKTAYRFQSDLYGEHGWGYSKIQDLDKGSLNQYTVILKKL